MFSRSEESGSVLEAPEVFAAAEAAAAPDWWNEGRIAQIREKKFPETSVKRAGAKKNTGARARACLCRC